MYEVPSETEINFISGSVRTPTGMVGTELKVFTKLISTYSLS